MERSGPAHTLEEEPSADLHDALRVLPGLAALAQHGAERGIGWIVVDLVEVGVIEDVLRLQSKLEISRSLRGKRELLQQRRIRVESPWISHVRKHERSVA